MPTVSDLPENLPIQSLDQPPPSVSDSSENCSGGDGNAMSSKKQAWNGGGAPVMAADSDTLCPHLVESKGSSPQLVPESAAAAAAAAQVSAPASAAQESVNLPPQWPATNNAKSNPPSLKQPVFGRQRSSRRGGGGGGSSMGGPARGSYHPLPPSPPPPYPVDHNPGSSYYNMAPAIIDPFPGNQSFSPNIWDPRAVGEFMPQTNFYTGPRNFFPRENFAFHPPGDGHYYYHNNRGGKRDHDRRMYSNVQDARFQNHMPPPRGFMSPSPPYITQLPQHVRPHGNTIPPPPPDFVYAPTFHMEPYTDMPPMHPMPPLPPMPQPSVHYPAIDPTLSASLIHQIEYYFSDGNLVTDAFLRFNMDEQGWVPISLVAGFSKVKKLTNNIQLIVEALRNSIEVEVQDYRIRKRNGWMRWPLSSSEGRTDSSSSSTLSGSNHDNLATSFQRARLDDGTN